jgi:DNA replication protein DnaC
MIDDFGVCRLPLAAAEGLLGLIMRHYERVSTLVTSNRLVEEWGKLLRDAAAVSAILDHLLRHGHLLKYGPNGGRKRTW